MSVAGHRDVARIAGDAVVPANEHVVFVGCRRQGGYGAIVVGSSPCHGAAFHWVGFGGNLVLQWLESSRIGGFTFFCASG